MILFRSVVSLLLVLLLVSCGFQLRGASNWPAGLSPVYLTGLDVREPLYVELERSLRFAGIEVLRERSPDGSEIRILSLVDDRRPLAVDGQGRISEYELVRAIEAELRHGAESPAVALGRIESRRAYPFDVQSVMSQAWREEDARQHMNRELVRMLQYRARAALSGGSRAP